MKTHISVAGYDPHPTRQVSDWLLGAMYEAARYGDPADLDPSAVADVVDELIRHRRRIAELEAATEQSAQLAHDMAQGAAEMEREACAKIADDRDREWYQRTRDGGDDTGRECWAAREVAAAIRARGTP